MRRLVGGAFLAAADRISPEQPGEVHPPEPRPPREPTPPEPPRPPEARPPKPPRPPHRLPPGDAAPQVVVKDDRFETLVRTALAADEEQGSVVWREADAEVVVHLDRTRVRTREGLVLVALTLECDQTGLAEVVVPFAVGTDEQPAGLVVASETKPRGPDVLVDRWGEAIVATAWRALIEAATEVARSRGSDLEGVPLRAGALMVGTRGIAVVPQARHTFEQLPLERFAVDPSELERLSAEQPPTQ